MNSLLATAFTGRDNNSLDIGRIIWMMLAVVMCALEIYSVVVQRERFDIVQFMTAAGGLMATGGVGLAIKSNTEPKGPS